MQCAQPNVACKSPGNRIGLRGRPPCISHQHRTLRLQSAARKQDQQVQQERRTSACKQGPRGEQQQSQQQTCAVCVAVELETIVAGLEGLANFHAFHAAARLLDHEIAGRPALYLKPMAQLLPVCQHPADAALMIKLLADEGVIGSRSTAGREGPVVGKPVRRSGSRPLLVAEIAEHWAAEVKPNCLLRWSRQAGLTPEQLETRLQAAYQQSQASSQWSVWDAAQVCHGSSGPSSGGGSSAWPSRQQSRFPASSQDGSNGSGLEAAATATIAAPALGSSTAAAAAEAPAAPDPAAAEGAAVAVTVQPCSPSVVPSIKASRWPCFVLSTHPLAATTAALAAVGLTAAAPAAGAAGAASAAPVASHCIVIHAPTLEQCVQRLTTQQQQLTVIVSSPNKAWQCQQHQQAAAAADSAAPVALRLQVAEWACVAPGLRAKALAAPALGLLSEVGLAELLGAADSDAVMDGIAWRD